MVWETIAAAAAPALIGGLFGGGGGGGQQISQEAVNRARQLGPMSSFRPYTVTSSMGQTGYNPMTGQTYSMMTPAYQDVLNQSLAGAGGIAGQLAGFDTSARAGELFEEQAALLRPEFQRQATDLQSTLFGSGRLGLRLAGESQGLGTDSGMVQPDALGLGRQQQQTLAQLAAGTRQQALDEGQQLAGMATSLLNMGLGVNQAEAQLIGMGVDAETARAAAQYAAGNLELSPYGAATTSADTAATNRMGLFGGVSAGLLSNPSLFNPGGSNPMTNSTNAVVLNRFGGNAARGFVGQGGL